VIYFFLTTFFLSTFAFAEGFALDFSKQKLAELKKYFDRTIAKGQPATTFEKVLAAYKVPHPYCNSTDLKKAIVNCRNFSCFKATDLGGTKMLAQVVVSQKNMSVGICLISHPEKRFFVGKENFSKFADLFILSYLNQDNEDEDFKILSEASQSGRALKQYSIVLPSKKCFVDLTYKFKADTTGFVPVKDVIAENDGYRVRKVGGKDVGVLTFSGVSYIQPINRLPLKIYAQVSDYKLSDESKNLCKNENATLLFELEKNGKVERLFPIN
jgi:hypothetical protein